MVSQEDMDVGRMYPPLDMIRECSVKIAADICETAYAENMASVYPEPHVKTDFIKAQLYDYNYDGLSALPPHYTWPEITQQPFANL